MKKVILGLFAIAFFVSCTENHMAKKFGGKTTVELEPGVRLVNVTWKEPAELWVLTKKDTTKPTTYSFKEHSSWGLVNGEVIIVEK